MKQLLVVAAAPTLPDNVASALEDIACALTCVSSAGEALAVLQSQRVDLVFLDLQGLAEDGLEVLQAIRSRGNPVPVFVTPTASPTDMDSLRAAAGRGLYYETMRTPVARDEIRAATTAAFSL